MVGHWLARARGGPAVVRATNTRAVDKALLADVDAEQLNRVTSMYEADGMAAIRGAFVVVIGVGSLFRRCSPHPIAHALRSWAAWDHTRRRRCCARAWGGCGLWTTIR